MKKWIHWVLIIGFVLVDWLIFHDIFKAGETYTVTEILTGILSLFVFASSARELMKKKDPSSPIQNG